MAASDNLRTETSLPSRWAKGRVGAIVASVSIALLACGWVAAGARATRAASVRVDATHAARACPALGLPRLRLAYHRVPPARVLSSLGILRRGQLPSDRADWRGWRSLAGVSSTYVPGLGALAQTVTIDASYIRYLGTDATGTPYYLLPLRVQLAPPISRRCLLRLPAALRRREIKLERMDRKHGAVGLGIASISDNSAAGQVPIGGGGYPASYHDLFTNRLTETGSGTLATGCIADALGVVPDGVASVGMRLHNGTELTTSVSNNYWRINIPLSLAHGNATTVWFDANDRLIGSFPGQQLTGC